MAGSKVRLLSGTQCILLITHRSEPAEQQLSPGAQLPPERSCSSKFLWVGEFGWVSLGKALPLCRFQLEFQVWVWVWGEVDVQCFCSETRKAELTGEIKSSLLWTHMRCWFSQTWASWLEKIPFLASSPLPPKKSETFPSTNCNERCRSCFLQGLLLLLWFKYS